MKTETLHIKRLQFPLAKPFSTNIKTVYAVDGIFLSLQTTDGLVGNSFIHTIGEMPCDAIIKHVHALYRDIVQQRALASVSTWKTFWSHYYHKRNLFEKNNRTAAFALAALDIAVWDLFSKEQKKPLYQLLNNSSTESVSAIRVYGTTGWLSLDEKALIQECEKYAERGIKAFKIRLGHAKDYERVRAVRKAMGDDYVLMLDATEQFTVHEAIAIAKKMTELNITWFEEPVQSIISDLKAIRQECSIPIAAGENMLTRQAFEVAAAEKAIDIAQPDILRCGGITGFIDIARMMEVYHVPLCNHLLPELSINILAAFSNAYYLEYDDLLPENIFNDTIILKNGYRQVSSIVGNGVNLTNDVLAHFVSR